MSSGKMSDITIHSNTRAILSQTLIRCAALITLAWLTLHYADGWIQAMMLRGAQ